MYKQELPARGDPGDHPENCLVHVPGAQRAPGGDDQRLVPLYAEFFSGLSFGKAAKSRTHGSSGYMDALFFAVAVRALGDSDHDEVRFVGQKLCREARLCVALVYGGRNAKPVGCRNYRKTYITPGTYYGIGFEFLYDI